MSCWPCISVYLVNKANLVHNLFLVYLSISTCFVLLCAHHQEKQRCLCDTWYLLFCVDDCLVCSSISSCIPDSHPHRITSTKRHINTVVSPDDGHIIARNMQILINMLLHTRQSSTHNNKYQVSHKNSCFSWRWVHSCPKHVERLINMILHTRQSTTQNNKYQVSHKHSCFSWRWVHSRPKHVEIDKYTKNKLCTKFALLKTKSITLS